MTWVLVVVVVLAVVLFALDRTALAAERRGWIYYRKKRRPPGTGLGLVTQIYHPAIEHVVDEEVSERTRADQDQSGQGDEPDA